MASTWEELPALWHCSLSPALQLGFLSCYSTSYCEFTTLLCEDKFPGHTHLDQRTRPGTSKRMWRAPPQHAKHQPMKILSPQTPL